MAQERPLKIHRVKSAGQGQALAAELFAGISDESPDSPVGLATGGHHAQVFTRRLRPMASAQKFSDAFALDEYQGISPASENSYANELTRKFTEPLKLPGKNSCPRSRRLRRPTRPQTI